MLRKERERLNKAPPTHSDERFPLFKNQRENIDILMDDYTTEVGDPQVDLHSYVRFLILTWKPTNLTPEGIKVPDGISHSDVSE